MMFLSGVVGVLVAVAIDQSMISFEGITYVSQLLPLSLVTPEGLFRWYIQDTFEEGEIMIYK